MRERLAFDRRGVLCAATFPTRILMFVGIGFLSLLTASIAYRFVKEERREEHVEVLEALRRIEAEVAELKARLPA